MPNCRSLWNRGSGGGWSVWPGSHFHAIICILSCLIRPSDRRLNELLLINTLRATECSLQRGAEYSPKGFLGLFLASSAVYNQQSVNTTPRRPQSIHLHDSSPLPGHSPRRPPIRPLRSVFLVQLEEAIITHTAEQHSGVSKRQQKSGPRRT